MNHAKDSDTSKVALDSFTRALYLHRSNQSAYRGAGMSHALVQAEDQALRMWREGNVQSDQLVEYGKMMWEQGLPNVAFVYLRSAQKLDAGAAGEASFFAGRLCQLTRVNMSVLSSDNRRYCTEYFVDNDNNLLLNGQFQYAPVWGWRGTDLFAGRAGATIELDQLIGVPASSLLLQGTSQGNHGGVYQRISVLPGATLRLSGHFRSMSKSELKARLLYVEWAQGSDTHGTSQNTLEASMDWRYFERTFTLPDDAEAWFQFYPVLLSGKGSVWVDDVRVEVLADSEGHK